MQIAEKIKYNYILMTEIMNFKKENTCISFTQNGFHHPL